MNNQSTPHSLSENRSSVAKSMQEILLPSVQKPTVEDHKRMVVDSQDPKDRIEFAERVNLYEAATELRGIITSYAHFANALDLISSPAMAQPVLAKGSEREKPFDGRITSPVGVLRSFRIAMNFLATVETTAKTDKNISDTDVGYVNDLLSKLVAEKPVTKTNNSETETDFRYVRPFISIPIILKAAKQGKLTFGQIQYALSLVKHFHATSVAWTSVTTGFNASVSKQTSTKKQREELTKAWILNSSWNNPVWGGYDTSPVNQNNLINATHPKSYPGEIGIQRTGLGRMLGFTLALDCSIAMENSSAVFTESERLVALSQNRTVYEARADKLFKNMDVARSNSRSWFETAMEIFQPKKNQDTRVKSMLLLMTGILLTKITLQSPGSLVLVSHAFAMFNPYQTAALVNSKMTSTANEMKEILSSKNSLYLSECDTVRGHVFVTELMAKLKKPDLSVIGFEEQLCVCFKRFIDTAGRRSRNQKRKSKYVPVNQRQARADAYQIKSSEDGTS